MNGAHGYWKEIPDRKTLVVQMSGWACGSTKITFISAVQLYDFRLKNTLLIPRKKDEMMRLGRITFLEGSLVRVTAEAI